MPTSPLSPAVTSLLPASLTTPNQPFFGESAELGHNWRLQFADADGVPFNMLSFEVIDFGAISHKEIFQNVKTILATPQFSAALERLLGVDQTIVDLPIDRAAEATVAILDALYFWEPRAETLDIQFSGDVIAGHLICTLKLRVKNVIFGTETPYNRANVFDTPTTVTQALPPVGELPPGPAGPVGPQGEIGPQGERGSLWFTGSGPPADIPEALPQDMHYDASTGTISQLTATQRDLELRGNAGPPGPAGPHGPAGAKGARASMWFFGTTDPPDIPDTQPYDMYLNTVTGDVWQLQTPAGGGMWKRVSHASNVDRSR